MSRQASGVHSSPSSEDWLEIWDLYICWSSCVHVQNSNLPLQNSETTKSTHPSLRANFPPRICVRCDRQRGYEWEQEGNGPIDEWLQSLGGQIWPQIWNQWPQLPTYPCAYCLYWPFWWLWGHYSLRGQIWPQIWNQWPQLDILSKFQGILISQKWLCCQENHDPLTRSAIAPLVIMIVVACCVTTNVFASDHTPGLPRYQRNAAAQVLQGVQRGQGRGRDEPHKGTGEVNVSILPWWIHKAKFLRRLSTMRFRMRSPLWTLSRLKSAR